MPAFSQTDLLRFFNEGEEDVSNDLNFLIDRISLNVVSDTSVYTIPNYVRAISRVTFLGKKLYPISKRDLREAFQPSNQKGRPFWYTYNNTGQNKIQIFPTPNVNVPLVTNVWDTDIPNGCIVEFFRISDNIQFRLPDWTRNYLLKKYVGQFIFQIEGPGQNLKLAQYFQKEWTRWQGEFITLVNEMHSAGRRLYIPDIESSNSFPGSPLLPIDKFGIGVDTGY